VACEICLAAHVGDIAAFRQINRRASA
jgi:hypothetical protein